MTRAAIQRANRHRLAILYSVAPHQIQLRGRTFTGRLDPVPTSISVDEGGVAVETPSVAYLRTSDLAAAGIDSFTRWESITIDGTAYLIAGHKHLPLLGEVSLQVISPQTS